LLFFAGKTVGERPCALPSFACDRLVLRAGEMGHMFVFAMMNATRHNPPTRILSPRANRITKPGEEKPEMGSRVAEILENGLSSIEILRDYNDKERYIVALRE